MKKILSFLFLFPMVHCCVAQTFEDLKINDKGALRFYFSFNSMHNKSHFSPEMRSIPFRTLGIEGDVYSFDKGEVRWNVNSKVCDDLIWLIGYTIKNKTSRTPEGDYSITGLFWWHYGYNVKSTEKLNISPGFSLSDYMVLMPEEDGISFTGNPSEKEDPHGWFWAAGPNIFIDYALPAKFSLHFNANYDFSFIRLNNKYKSILDPDYKKPHYFHAALTLNHNSGFYLGYQFTRVVDLGYHKNNIVRSEVNLGFRVLLN